MTPHDRKTLGAAMCWLAAMNLTAVAAVVLWTWRVEATDLLFGGLAYLVGTVGVALQLSTREATL